MSLNFDVVIEDNSLVIRVSHAELKKKAKEMDCQCPSLQELMDNIDDVEADTEKFEDAFASLIDNTVANT